MAAPQPSAVVAAFLSALSPEARDALEGGETVEGGGGAALQEALTEALERARAAWPQLEVAPERFAAFLGERYGAQGGDLADPGGTLGTMHAADLFLAYGCCVGDEAAVAAFDRGHTRDLDAALARLSVSPDTADEVKQRLRDQLLVSEEGDSPALAKYSGRGRLAGWLRVSVTRLALRQLKQQKRRAATADDLVVLPVAGDDPELAYLKDLYRGEFRSSFERAMAALTPRQRNLLRHQLVDHLSIDEIGALYRVHRATAARWLEAARQDVVTAIKGAMMDRLQIRGEEYESIMRLIHSGVELSISRHLGERADPEPEEP